ncbi:MAG: nitrite reductase (NAD(P)H) small subunit [Microthrixaceae bacterium]|nr:nitrite reductase (NAD(P)H) small subunit [Acidimicrobiales bacterium]MCB9402981.1 nitrite reductase (NAD(P)H) small subunit [Microthrixaceae bacterium]
MTAEWVPVAPLADLIVGHGVGALVNDECVAVFRLSDTEVVAVGAIDPRSGANVMAHGITGSLPISSEEDADHDGTVIRYVASPLDKHRYRLDTGQPLTEGDPALTVWEVRIVDGVVEVADALVTPAM